MSTLLTQTGQPPELLMDANIPITAAIFSAFLKCSTKAHLMATGERTPGTHFAHIEAHISSMYKAAAKRQSPIGGEVAEFLDFGERWRTLDHDAITHYVDCDTAVYDLAPPPHRTGGRHRQKFSPSGTLVPIRFLPWDKPGLSDSLLVSFGALALSQATGFLTDTGTVIYGEGHRRKTVMIGDHAVRTRQTIDAIRITCHRSEPPSLVLNRHCAVMRLPTKVSRLGHRTRRFEPAQRDDWQGAGQIECQGHLHDNAAVLRLPPATTQAQQT